MLNCQTKTWIQKISLFREILCKIVKHSDWLRKFFGPHGDTTLINQKMTISPPIRVTFTKYLYPPHKNLTRCATKSWHIADLILNNCPYQWTHTHINELNQIDLCMHGNVQKINHGMKRVLRSPRFQIRFPQ